MTEAEPSDERYYARFAAAYVRAMLSVPDDRPEADLIALGRSEGLKLHRFKRTMDLPRVKAVIGALRGIQPDSLLDIGSGRGVFLWPLLDAFPDLTVTAIDLLEHRRAVLEAVRAGGIDRLSVHDMSVTELGFGDDSFDVATVLEVLEHLVEPAQAVRELVRVARRFVVASVPSKEDDNPEHIQLFDGAALERMFTDAGARNATVTYVRGHIVCVATL